MYLKSFFALSRFTIDQISYQVINFIIIAAGSYFLSPNKFLYLVTPYSVALTLSAPIMVLMGSSVYYIDSKDKTSHLETAYGFIGKISVLFIPLCIIYLIYLRSLTASNIFTAVFLMYAVSLYDYKRKSGLKNNVTQIYFHMSVVVVIVLVFLAEKLGFFGNSQAATWVVSTMFLGNVIVGIKFNKLNQSGINFYNYLRISGFQALSVFVFAMYTQFGLLLMAKNLKPVDFEILRTAFNFCSIIVVVGIGIDNYIIPRVVSVFRNNFDVIVALDKIFLKTNVFYIFIAIFFAFFISFLLHYVYKIDFCNVFILVSIFSAASLSQNLTRSSIIHLKNMEMPFPILIGDFIGLVSFYYLISLNNSNIYLNAAILSFCICISCIPTIFFSLKWRKRYV